MSNYEAGLDNVPIQCPHCGKMSDSVKCYSLPNYLLFVGVFVAYSFKKEICCPECMRKKILVKYFTYNIIIGNFLWLLLGLPMGLWKLCSSYTKGHSKTVQDILADHVAEIDAAEIAQVSDPADQYGAPVYGIK